MPATTTPYKLQIFVDPDMRKALKDAAHHEQTSVQRLVTAWLAEKLLQHPSQKQTVTQEG